MSWKSVPGSNVTRPPTLIGAPVAFFPVPRPQTLLVAVCFPAPIGAAAPPAPPARAVTSAAARPLTASVTAILSFVELIRPPCSLRWDSAAFTDCLRHERPHCPWRTPPSRASPQVVQAIPPRTGPRLHVLRRQARALSCSPGPSCVIVDRGGAFQG